ncbi:MAG: hypothetical protein LAO78_04380 [Acidobacteriia bacterium]|nr:hypothetical protein [Terriglobia bacterium]
MIGSYMDESFDIPPNHGIFAVGGIMARGVPIFELERRWEKLLKRPDIDIEYFKASQCQAGTKQFKKFVSDPKNITPSERTRLDSISLEFLDTIAHMPLEPNSFLVATGIGVVQEDFYEVIKDDYARSVLGNSPYFLAYHLAMIQCAWSMKTMHDDDKRFDDSVSFICDLCEEHSDASYEAYRLLKEKNPKAAAYMGVYGAEDEKQCFPLQAADAVIYEIRRAFHVALGQRKEQLRKQFNILDNKALFAMQHCSKKNLLHIVATHKPGEPFKLDEIMDDKFNEDIRF